MQIVRDLAGYSYGRSDLVRRAMAKKKHKVMEQEREYFVHGMTDETGKVVIPGCVRNGVPEDVANQIYDEMISFASYAFNKSHAAAYSVVAMETGWLKRYHPVPFMAAIMNSVFGNSEKIAAYIQYCRGRNIPILPPSVNTSTWKFTVEKQQDGTLGIRFGLGAVKGVGAGAVEAIVSERQKGRYTDIFDFCRRINTEAVNKRVVDSLIRAGAFDCTGAKRSQMMLVYEAAMDSAATQRKNNVAGQMSLFDFAADMGMAPETPALPRVPEHPQRALLAMEKEMTGVYISGHPLDEHRELLQKMTFSTADLAELDERPDHGMGLDGQMVEMGGILTEVKGKATKKGAYMGFVTLEDLSGQIEGLIFPKVFEKYQGMIAADDLVVLEGRLSIREEESPKLLVEAVIPLEQWEPGGLERTSRAPRGKRPSAPHRAPAPQKTDAQWAQESDRKLYLRLPRAQLDAVAASVALHPGSVPVYLHIPQEKLTLLAPRTGWCDASPDCLARLSNLLGAENVKLTGV